MNPDPAPRKELPNGPPPAPPNGEAEPRPALLRWAGALLLLVLLLWAAFALGAYAGERGYTHGIVPPWPEPLPTATPAAGWPVVPAYFPHPLAPGLHA